ncbi:MAG: SNF2-related protein [Actinomycetota bacterium]|nr:SNF2-related protein [Actinomycetota bacterium]
MTSVAALEALVEHNATDPERVSAETARRQLATAAALRERLDEYGGAILGDEVGAGKTFVTFALIAEALLRDDTRGAVIFVPREILARKWVAQLREYLEVSVRDADARSRLTRRVTTMDRSLRTPEGRVPSRRQIVVTTHSVFSYKVSDADRAVCLGLWLELRCRARRKPWKRLFRACGIDVEQYDETWSRWAGSDLLGRRELEPLDEVWERWENGERDLRHVLRKRVQDVRRNAGRRILRHTGLVVVDEAHHLRSTASQIYRSLMSVLSGNFDALLFLTATPFQLGRDELRTVVSFFRHARRHADRQEEFARRVARMDAGMAVYVDALDRFGEAWQLLQPGEDREVLAALDGSPPSASTRTAQAVERFRACLAAKDQLEAGLRPFLVRSVREHRHAEFLGLDRASEAITPESRIPLALVDRLITELLAERERTYIASALTSACSSWQALFDAEIARRGGEASANTRRLLERLRDARALGPHPKLEHTAATCLEGVARGEKTLVFVERRATGDALLERIEKALGDWHDRNAWQRLQAPARFGWPSLRENYLHTLYPEVFGAPPTPDDCLALLRGPAALRLWRRVDEAELRDYKREKRLLEHVVFRAAASRDPYWRGRARTPQIRECVERLLDERYVLNGLDMRSGSGGTRPVPPSPRRAEPRDPNWDFALAYAGYRSPWHVALRQVRILGPDARADLVDAAAGAIASSHLQDEIARIEAEGRPAAHFDAVARLLATPPWPDRFIDLAQEAVDVMAHQGARQAADRVGRLVAALRAGRRRVQFIHGQTKQDTRQNAVDGFNTPMYPEIIISTAILGEGIDLHRQCRRVIHHDLPWNPASLEQRTGRVDRIGSLAIRLDRDIDVWLPFMPGTYDETIYNRVMARRREFRCVLGSKPEWQHEQLGEAEAEIPIPPQMVDRLQVDLGPDRSGRRPAAPDGHS